MSSQFLNQSRANHVITWKNLIVRVRTLRPDSFAKWPESVAKWRQSLKVTLAQNRSFLYYFNCKYKLLQSFYIVQYFTFLIKCNFYKCDYFDFEIVTDLWWLNSQMQKYFVSSYYRVGVYMTSYLISSLQIIINLIVIVYVNTRIIKLQSIYSVKICK